MKVFIFLPIFFICSLGHSQDAELERVNPSTYLNDLKKEMQIEWPNNRTINLVFHGHSVPSGYFITPEVNTLAAYPALVLKEIKARYPFAVVNVIVTAIGGENSVQDRGEGLEKSSHAWMQMLIQAKEQNIKVILLTPSPDQRVDYTDANNELQQHTDQVIRLAKEHQVGLVDSYKAFEFLYTDKDKLRKYMSQVNHPNEKGHELIAREIIEYFK